ncbi:diguanylate cyclase [Haloimpatiens sp. FM7330]|uniref:sensor domain-containing diguanylate cyclase n=1 Tax=Haloimpatiens sp. FM7330 TaxID=3298610 RepID=UPI0036337DD1
MYIIEKLKHIHYIILVIFIFIIVVLIINVIKYKKIERELKDSRMKLEKNFNFLKTILDTIPEPLFSKDLSGRYTACNTEYAKCLGMKREEVINKTVYEIKQGKFANIYHKADLELMNKKGKQVYESKFKYPDGEVHDVVFRKAAITSENGEVDGLVGIMIDITKRKKNENRINKLLKIKGAMLEINQSIIGINDIDELFQLILEKAISVINGAEYGSILILNENGIFEVAASKGFDKDKMKSFNLPLEKSFLWIKTKGNIKNSVIIDYVDKLEDIEIIDTTNKKKDWQIKSVISTPIIIEGKLYGILNIDSDERGVFTQVDIETMEYMKSQIEISICKHKLYKEILYLSKFDKLTGLYNRSYFERKFDECLQNISGTDKSFNIVIFDINGLKKVNDKYGHLNGDEYIKKFTSELKRRVQSTDILARYGGDEFIGLFLNSSEDKLTCKFEKIIEHLKKDTMKFYEDNVICSFSYGISSFPQDGDTYSDLIKIADSRMYEYKRKFKNSKILE